MYKITVTKSTYGGESSQGGRSGQIVRLDFSGIGGVLARYHSVYLVQCDRMLCACDLVFSSLSVGSVSPTVVFSATE